MNSVMRFAVIVILCFAAGGCWGSSEAYRYKLSMKLNTPNGIREASSVVGIKFFSVSIPARGIMHKLNGEALYLDLGPGQRPLIALLEYTADVRPYTQHMRWGNETGPSDELLSSLYGPMNEFSLDEVARISHLRGAHKITSNDLPVLVTFANVGDPASVIVVDPNNLEATLGAGVSWNEISLEITDEPVTTGIEQKLPWLVQYYQKNLRLDGDNLIWTKKREVSNKIGWECFVFSEEFLTAHPRRSLN